MESEPKLNRRGSKWRKKGGQRAFYNFQDINCLRWPFSANPAGVRKILNNSWKCHSAQTSPVSGNYQLTHNFHLQHLFRCGSSLSPPTWVSHSLSPQALSQSASSRLPPSVSSTRLRGLILLRLSAPQCLHKLKETETQWLWRRVLLKISTFSFSITNPDVCLRGFKRLAP